MLTHISMATTVKNGNLCVFFKAMKISGVRRKWQRYHNSGTLLLHLPPFSEHSTTISRSIHLQFQIDLDIPEGFSWNCKPYFISSAQDDQSPGGFLPYLILIVKI